MIEIKYTRMHEGTLPEIDEYELIQDARKLPSRS